MKQSYDVSHLVDELIDHMTNEPERFVVNEYTMKDTKTNYEYWIANTFLNAKVYEPFELDFGLNGWRFKKAVKALKVCQAIHKMRDAE